MSWATGGEHGADPKVVGKASIETHGKQMANGGNKSAEARSKSKWGCRGASSASGTKFSRWDKIEVLEACDVFKNGLDGTGGDGQQGRCSRGSGTAACTAWRF